MTRIALIASLVLTAVLLTGCSSCPMCGESAAKDHTGHLRHVVVFKFTDDATPEQVQAVVDHFGRLQDEIPEIIDYEWGVNNSPEGHDQSFTHVFLVTFKDEAGREVYLPHPAHQKFVEHLKPILDKVFVVDYTVR